VGAVTNFQTIALTVAAVLFAATLAAAAARAINRRAAFAWILLWIAAAAAIARPSITMAVARFLGIGRGADLVFYCAILGMLIALFLIYLRFKRLEREITTIVRHLALRQEETADRGSEQTAP
jgi:small membrane protein